MSKPLSAKIAPNGRLVLPKKVREALGMPDGGTVVFAVDRGEVKLTPLRQSIRQAQELYLEYATMTSSTDPFCDRDRESPPEELA